MDLEYNLKKICRTCLLEESELYDLFDTNEITIQSPFDILSSCTRIQILPNDNLPHQICRQCLYQANQTLLFQNQCEKSDSTLKFYISQREKSKLNIRNTDEVSKNVDDTTERSFPDYEFKDEETSPSDILQITVKTEPPETNPLSNDEEDNLSDNEAIDNFQNSKHTYSKTRVKQIPESLTCVTCNKSFKYANCYSKHILIHSLNLQAVVGGKERKNVLQKINKQCLKESFEHNTRNKTLNDKKSNINDDIVDDDAEEEDFKNILSEDAMNAVNIGSSDTLICKLCGKSFHRHANLRRHLMLHQGNKSHLCNICGKAFTQSAYLRIHMRTHSNERPHACTICSRSFKQRSSLNVHYLTHSDIRAHVCSICGKTFKWNAVLKTHMLSHTDERNYECSVCGTKFKIAKHLSRHLLTHTGEKKHACSQCGKFFNRPSNLRVHFKIHTGERPHACTVCDKAFLYKHCLQNHMKTHEC